MAKINCSVCGAEVSSWNCYPGKVCKACHEAETKRLRDAEIEKLGVHPAHCKMTIINAVWKSGVAGLVIGDIFLTDEAIVKIGYTYTGTGATEEIIGFLVGGVIGGTAASLTNTKEYMEAKDRADNLRDQDYGVTLEDRIRKHGGSVILREDVLSIDADRKHQIIHIVCREGGFDYSAGTTDESFEKLQKWLRHDLEDQEDPEGVNCGLPPVNKLIDVLKSGEQPPELPEIDQSKVMQSYIGAMLKLFAKLKKPEKIAATDTISKLSDAWKDFVRNYFQKEHAKARKHMKISVFFFAVGIIGPIYLLINISDLSKGMDLLGFIAFMASCSLLVTITFIIDSNIKGRLYEELLSRLEKGNRPD